MNLCFAREATPPNQMQAATALPLPFSPIDLTACPTSPYSYNSLISPLFFMSYSSPNLARSNDRHDLSCIPTLGRHVHKIIPGDIRHGPSIVGDLADILTWCILIFALPLLTRARASSVSPRHNSHALCETTAFGSWKLSLNQLAYSQVPSALSNHVGISRGSLARLPSQPMRRSLLSPSPTPAVHSHKALDRS